MTDTSSSRAIATYKDIQRVTGLSLSTISKFYNGGTVRPANGRAIEEAAAQLGFQINDFARNLRRGRSKTVGVLLPALDNVFHLGIIAGIEGYLQEHGVSVIVVSSHPDGREPGEAVSALRSKMVDGIIAVPSAHDVAALAAASASGLPVVTIDRAFSGLETDHVQLDNEAAGAVAGRHLVDHRHTQVAMIGGDGSVPSLSERRDGFIRTLDAAGIEHRPEWFTESELTVEAGRRAMRGILALPERPTAVFTGNYELTIGALIALNESGLTIPADVSLIGFDVAEVAQVTRPRLTTFVQPMHALAEHAADRILNRMNDDPPTTREVATLPGDLQFGGSVSRLSERSPSLT